MTDQMTDAQALNYVNHVITAQARSDEVFAAWFHITARLRALSEQPFPKRYGCNGPEGTFWTDDAVLANKLIKAAFDRDDWTVTDMQNPTGKALSEQQRAACGEVRIADGCIVSTSIKRPLADGGYDIVPQGAHSQLAAGDAVRALPATWSGEMVPDAIDPFDAGLNYAFRRCADQLQAALAAAPAARDPFERGFSTQRREKAVEAMLADGWKWDGSEWTRPPAAPESSLPPRDINRSVSEQGLFRKFDVRRTDGSDAAGGKHYGCDYFVLDMTHDPLAKAAAAAYADAAQAAYPDLASDMRARYGLHDAAPVAVPEGMDEARMREASVPTLETIRELAAYIDGLIERDHEYGTCVYAMSMAATATFQHVAKRLVVTGFQASCADLDVIRRTRRLDGPFILVNGSDALFPQYDLPEKVRSFLTDIQPWLADQAAQKLQGDLTHVAPRVLAHWRSLAEAPQAAREVPHVG